MIKCYFYVNCATGEVEWSYSRSACVWAKKNCVVCRSFVDDDFESFKNALNKAIKKLKKYEVL